MSKKRKRNVNPEVDLFCEWSDCSERQHTVMDNFIEHLKSHCDQAINTYENLDIGLCCSWSGCNEAAFANTGELRVHISYHGFHSKLMSYGLLEMKSISQSMGKEIVCRIDGSTRTLLPPLPDMFVCGWKNCFAIFHGAEEFYRHVEKHPFDRNNKISEQPLNTDLVGYDKIEENLSEETNNGSINNDKPNGSVKCFWLDCTFVSDSNSHVAQHLRSHTQEKIIACPNCGAMFSHKGKFRDHLLRQLDDGEQMVNDTEAGQTLTLEINQDKEIMITIHPPNSLPQPSSSLLYQCDRCDKSFLSSSLLREHNRRHYHYYRCDICGQTTDSPSALKHHKTYRHSDDRPFACQFCEAKFKTRSDLRKHLEIHNEDNPFKCNLCSFECRCCHTLAKHVKRQHQATDNEYLCHECDKKFTRGNNLTRHLMTIHGYTLKPGQSRFIYARDDDGIFKLTQT